MIEIASRTIRRFLLAWMLVFAGGPAAWAADETFETLAVGHQTYTKVRVLSKTRTDVFISHSKGMTSLKVKDLDVATQMKLGYQVDQPKPSKMVQMEEAFKAPDLENLQEDPRMKKLDAKTAAWISQTIKKLDVATIFGILGGVAVFYLLFCFLCRTICMKTAAPPTALIPLVWFPIIQLIPLFKAAGMSPWWMFVPFVNYFIWSFKIVKARGKPIVVGVLLLLPGINLLAFLYLALSRGCGDDEPSNPNVITLQSGPRKEAA